MSASQQIGRYQIVRELGRGGMAIVYLARDPNINRQVAVKVLPRQFSFDPHFRSRFRREAEVIARLEHPAIVPIYDFGEHDEQPYIVMRLMTGGSLADRLAQEPMTLQEVIDLFNHIAPALDEAHEQNIIHRDLKPANILFDHRGKPYLSDFGIVKLAEGQATALTASGGIIGTPAYMSPEQARGNVVLDGRSDIYALGVILFEALSGQRPYENDTPMGLAMMHVLEPIPRLLEHVHHLPVDAQKVIDQALAKERADRFATARQMATAIAQLAQPEQKQQPQAAPPTVPLSSSQPKPAEPHQEETEIEAAHDAAPTSQFATHQSPQDKEKIHPYVSEAGDMVRQGRMSRRTFLYIAALLGCSVTAAAAGGGLLFRQQFRDLLDPSEDTPTITSNEVTVEDDVSSFGIRRGGNWLSAIPSPLLSLPENPARTSTPEQGNLIRQLGDYLAFTGADGLTTPYLLDRWEVSDDLKTWDLYLPEGITFSNGDELTAEDLLATFELWLDEDVGSPMYRLLTYIGGAQNVEIVNTYRVRLNLNEATIHLPEHLFHYPAIILHRDFNNDFDRRPVGTGPFTLAEYTEGERIVFQRREDYWRMGADNRPLPYLDQVTYLGVRDEDAAVTALSSGQIDSFNLTDIADWRALEDQPDLTVYPANTAGGLIIRMRVDLEPWSDNRVRTALKKCQDREQILQSLYHGQGTLAIDAHVAPAHPAYVEKPIPDYDPEGSLALLQEYAAEQGVELPLQVTLAMKDDQNEPELGELLKELAEPGGFEITLDITSPAGYWDRWTEVDFGITPWTAHRTAATMILPVAYTEEALGNWNETHWTDPEFEETLQQALETIDLEQRRQIMSDIEDIMQERGPIAVSFWHDVWTITHRRFQNVTAHPDSYDLLTEVWEEAEES